jgi:type II secretory pathway pseudopilin PulG
MTARRRAQGGYTLVELIIASGLAAVVLAALTSVIFVVNQANRTWSPRLQATGEMRRFEHSFYDDAASGSTPTTSATVNPCLVPGSAPTPPIVVRGLTYSGNTAQPYSAVYCFDPIRKTVKRFVGATSTLIARNVTVFSWSLHPGDNDTIPCTDPSVTPCVIVIDITTTDYNSPPFYTTTQRLRFYPRRNTP